MSEPDITIYTKKTCGFCHRAKALLLQKQVQFNEIAVDFDREKFAQMIKRSQQRTVPQIWIKGRHVGGCTELYALERSGELDKLLTG